MDWIEVGLRITRARREKKWTQKDLASASACSQQLVSQAELGELRRLETVQQIAKAVGLRVDLTVAEDESAA